MNNLNFRKHPQQDGKYLAANHNKMHNRLEIEKVSVVNGEVFVEGDSEPFIFTDFDFWSEPLTED